MEKRTSSRGVFILIAAGAVALAASKRWAFSALIGLAFASAAPGALIVSWGPGGAAGSGNDIVTGTASFNTANAPKGTTALSLANYNAPGHASYYVDSAGKTPLFYSAGHKLIATEAVPGGTVSDINSWQIASIAGGDYILAAHSAVGDGQFGGSAITSVQVRQIHLWTKNEFLGEANTASSVTLNGMTVQTGDSGSVNTTSARFVIRLGTDYYISNSVGESVQSFTDPTAVTWNLYDPLTSFATIGSAASLTASDFNNLTAAGVYVVSSPTTMTGGAQSRVLQVQVDATPVPEPISAMLAAPVALLLGRRRRV